MEYYIEDWTSFKSKMQELIANKCLTFKEEDPIVMNNHSSGWVWKLREVFLKAVESSMRIYLQR